jgi:hypothetical protein
MHSHQRIFKLFLLSSWMLLMMVLFQFLSFLALCILVLSDLSQVSYYLTLLLYCFHIKYQAHHHPHYHILNVQPSPLHIHHQPIPIIHSNLQMIIH